MTPRPARFKRLADHELDNLTDEELIAYIRGAYASGEEAAGRRGLSVLVYGYAQIVQGRVALRVPREDVAEVADSVVVRAIASTFDGSSVGQFRAWLNTITDRTVADFYRARARRPREVALEETGDDDSESREKEIAVPGETGLVELTMVLNDIMSSLSDTHREVVQMHVIEGFPAPEVCRRVDGMTADNVAQIASRFRRQLRKALGSGASG